MPHSSVIRHAAALASLALTLSACAPKTWVAGPNVAAADFGTTRGRCLLAAGQTSTGLYSSGSVGFVIAAQAINAIGNVMKENFTYTHCMETSGFRIAGKAYTAQPGVAAVVPVAREPLHLLTPQYASSIVPAPNAYATATQTDSQTGPAAAAAPQDVRSPLVIPPATPRGDVTYRWGAPTTD